MCEILFCSEFTGNMRRKVTTEGKGSYLVKDRPSVAVPLFDKDKTLNWVLQSAVCLITALTPVKVTKCSTSKSPTKLAGNLYLYTVAAAVVTTVHHFVPLVSEVDWGFFRYYSASKGLFSTSKPEIQTVTNSPIKCSESVWWMCPFALWFSRILNQIILLCSWL